jgi:hypothetical protein
MTSQPSSIAQIDEPFVAAIESNPSSMSQPFSTDSSRPFAFSTTTGVPFMVNRGGAVGTRLRRGMVSIAGSDGTGRRVCVIVAVFAISIVAIDFLCSRTHRVDTGCLRHAVARA